MMARLRRWWEHGKWGRSPYVDGDGEDRVATPDAGPKESDWARVRLLESRVEAIRLSVRDRALRDLERLEGER